MKGTTVTPAARVCGDALGQRLGAVVGPAVGHDGLDTVALHARQHIASGCGPELAVPGFFVVVQVRVEQRAGVVASHGRRADKQRKQ
jgi:hypothetical protein